VRVDGNAGVRQGAENRGTMAQDLLDGKRKTALHMGPVTGPAESVRPATVAERKS
jgi:hypothetical protein